MNLFVHFVILSFTLINVVFFSYVVFLRRRLLTDRQRDFGYGVFCAQTFVLVLYWFFLGTDSFFSILYVLFVWIGFFLMRGREKYF